MEEKHKTLLEAVFGESSDGEDSDHHQQNRFEDSSNHSEKNPSWEPIRGISGLWLCRDFLSPQEQFSLLSAIGQGFLLFFPSSLCLVAEKIHFSQETMGLESEFCCGLILLFSFHTVSSETKTEHCVFNVVGNNCYMFELISVVISEMGHRSCVVWIWLKLMEQFKDR